MEKRPGEAAGNTDYYVMQDYGPWWKRWADRLHDTDEDDDPDCYYIYERNPRWPQEAEQQVACIPIIFAPAGAQQVLDNFMAQVRAAEASI